MAGIVFASNSLHRLSLIGTLPSGVIPGPKPSPFHDCVALHKWPSSFSQILCLFLNSGLKWCPVEGMCETCLEVTSPLCPCLHWPNLNLLATVNLRKAEKWSLAVHPGNKIKHCWTYHNLLFQSLNSPFIHVAVRKTRLPFSKFPENLENIPQSLILFT